MRPCSLSLVSSIRRAAVATLGFSAIFASGGAWAAVPGISVDSVQLRHPWNGIVDITYTLTVPAGVAPLNALTNQIEFVVTDNSVSPAATYIAADFDKVVPMTAGTHHLTWNANRNGYSFKSANVSVTARIRTFAAKYMIVDLAGGLTDGKYKITYADCEPEGGFTNTVYKGDKIVFRYIPPGNFLMGSPTTEANRNAVREQQRVVALTKPFYVGIYEVTQKQYTYVKGSSPGGNKGDFRPVEKISWSDIRGKGVSDYPADKTVSASSFIGLMRARTGIDIDLLTDAQWEYACRAGTTTPFNDGVEHASNKTYANSLNVLARYPGNVNDGKGGYDGGTAIVGSYKPNAWGLYDMHGNVMEWVLDGGSASDQIADQTVDPEGVASSWRIQRGGAFTWGNANTYCRSACRENPANGGNGGNNFIGFRIGAPASVTDK